MSLAYLIMEKGQELMSAVHDALCTGKRLITRPNTPSHLHNHVQESTISPSC